MRFLQKSIFYLFIFIGVIPNLKASHIFGGEIGYTHISGNTYEINLTLYGDCSGASYPNLFSSTPHIAVYDGNVGYTSLYLLPFGNPGFEVTPVCPAEINNTKCQGGSLPGVAEFKFKGNVTLSGPSADWKFIFDGELASGSSYAGRSGAITNIVQQGQANTTIMQLIATLNNMQGPNNSSTYTSIPTPFFCINIPQQYNQGAVDVNGDQLSFELVPALDANTGIVTYQSGYTFLNPVATTAGSFSFGTGTGQLGFTPNIIQNSVVVNKVVETRNGVVVGTTMREMTFVVLNNCNNQSPIGQLVGTSAGSISANNEVRVCNTGTTIQFAINASDPDTNNVSVTITGLPANALATITGNNSPSVDINVTWTIPAGAPLGSTTFYVTYQDNGCPLSSKQTIAYSVVVEQPILANLLSENVSCLANNDGQITVNATSSNAGALSYSLNGQTPQTNNLFQGLTAGTYTIQIKDPQNCSLDLEIDIDNSVHPELSLVEKNNITCFGKQNGKIAVTATPTTTYDYKLSPGNQTNSTGYFSNLAQNLYTIIAIDNKNCSDTLEIEIIEPPVLAFGQVEIENLTCNKNNGRILAKSNAIGEADYILNPGLRANGFGLFSDLAAGTYTITAQTGLDCSIDTVVTLEKLPLDFFVSTTQVDLGCNGWGYEGSAKAILNGGIEPFTYLWSSSPPQNTPEATGLYYGYYILSVTDARGCEVKDTVYINPGNCCENIYAPNAFSPNGDGKNDEWKLVTSTGMTIEHFGVYNRFGQRIWTTFDQRRAWDGTQNGQLAEPGTYFFVLQYTCLSDGKKYIKKGDVILLQ